MAPNLFTELVARNDVPGTVHGERLNQLDFRDREGVSASLPRNRYDSGRGVNQPFGHKKPLQSPRLAFVKYAIAVIVAATMATAVGTNAAGRQSSGPSPSRLSTSHPRAVLQQYCIGCHNSRTRAGELTLESVDVDNPAAHPETWEKVVRKLRTGAMPPAGMPRPDEATYHSLASSLEAALDAAAARRPHPGAPWLHRLNRTEYANAIRDLLALEIDAASLLPAEDAASGFDNNAGLLSVSPTLLERYLSAAAKISALAVGDATLIGPASQTYVVRGDVSQSAHLEGLPLGTRAGYSRAIRSRWTASTSSRPRCCKPIWAPCVDSSSGTTSSSRWTGHACSRPLSVATRTTRCPPPTPPTSSARSASG